MAKLTQEEIKETILKSEKSVYFTIDDLRYPFQFRRIDGFEYALKKIDNQFITEEKLSLSSDSDIHPLIRAWGAVNDIYFNYDEVTKGYYFLRKNHKKTSRDDWHF